MVQISFYQILNSISTTIQGQTIDRSTISSSTDLSLILRLILILRALRSISCSSLSCSWKESLICVVVIMLSGLVSAAEAQPQPEAPNPVSSPVQSQAAPAVDVPERDEPPFLQPAPLPVPLPAQDSPLQLPPAPPNAAPESDTLIPVQQIQVVGSTVFSDADFAPLVQPFEGRSLTLEELRGVADQITQLYLDRGYITSRAVLVDQVIAAGVVQIRVIEGSIEQIEIEGARRTASSYIRSRIRLGAKTPISQNALEDQLRLLRLDPLFENVEASLRPGSGLGQSILVVRVTETNSFFGSVGVDNYSPPSVGSERLGLSLGYRNLTGQGDELFGSYYHSTTGGSNVFDLSYRIPLNPMNGTLQLRTAPSSYHITDPEFAGFDIEGRSRLYEFSYRQPLVRSPREELALSVGFTYEDGETLVLNTLADESTTSVIRFGQEYVRREPTGAWALRSQFNLGTDLFNATRDTTPDGQFFSWIGQAQRVQILNPHHLLIAQLDVQLTPNALLPSQQFVIGGGQSIRGYEQNARLGDNGIRFSIEDRIAILRNEAGAPTLQIAPFADLGAVWNASNPANSLLDQNVLAAVGLGILWEPLPGFNVRADFGLPLVELDDRGTNAQDRGFFFSVNYHW